MSPPEEKVSGGAIRSFVVRNGRVTPAQRRALERLGPDYLLDPERPFVPGQAFGRAAPVCLEIGFGNGEALLDLAQHHPDRDYLGVEVYLSGIGRLLAGLERAGLTNVRVYHGDAMDVLEHCIGPGQLAAVHVWFPDPWPKKRHHKRRLVQADFLARVCARLAPGGLLHMATDWEAYAEHMRTLANGAPELINQDPQGGFAPGPGGRPVTRFQRRGQALGHRVWDLCYRRATGAGP